MLLSKQMISVLALAGGMLLATAAQAQTIWYVDDDGDPRNGCTSWPDACPNLQTALSKAAAGDQIWVAEGTYRASIVGRSPVVTFQLINGVAIRGGFDGSETTLEERAGLFDQTILTGDRAGDDVPVPCELDSPDCDSFGGRCLDGFCIIEQNNGENSYHLITGSGTDASAILDGFTIKAGNANGPYPFDSGGGMFNVAGSPTVINCTFRGNAALSRGGGMFNDAPSGGTEPGDRDGPSSPILIACTFIGNIAVGGGAIFNFDGSSPLIKNCIFAYNAAGSPPDVAGAGGAVVNVGHCTPIFDSCRFIENSANGRGGGLSFFLSDAVVTNCTFRGNTAASEGGGISSILTTLTVTNCTFSGNHAENGRALVLDSLGAPKPSDLSMSNCILWDGGGEVWNDVNSMINISYSNVQGGWPGEGNIDADPLFVDADGPDGNLRLSPGSPAIDSADNTALPADDSDQDGDGDTDEPIPFDLDGNPRIVDGDEDGEAVVDMGAFEFQGLPSCPQDVNGDGAVGPADLATLLASWGPCQECPADFDGDGSVGPVDLAQLLAAWGPCP